jgi:hypothetical protein
MIELVVEKPSFFDSLREDMNSEEFQQLISERLTRKDKKVIGQQASAKVAAGFRALAVMAPSPIHYGSDIVEDFIRSGIKFKAPSDERTAKVAKKSILRIMEVGKREGILKERDEDKRLEIDKRLSETLYYSIHIR